MAFIPLIVLSALTPQLFVSLLPNCFKGLVSFLSKPAWILIGLFNAPEWEG